MSFKLKEDAKVKYSKTERRAFGFLGSEAITSVDIKKKMYRSSEEPHNAQKIIIGVLGSLRKKIKANREPFTLMSSERRGPHPIEFWLAKKA